MKHTEELLNFPAPTRGLMARTKASGLFWRCLISVVLATYLALAIQYAIYVNNLLFLARQRP